MKQTSLVGAVPPKKCFVSWCSTCGKILWAGETIEIAVVHPAHCTKYEYDVRVFEAVLKIPQRR